MKEIYKELAIKYNLKPEQIKDIIISKFLFIRRELKSFDDSEFENLKTFHVTGFGKFFHQEKNIEMPKDYSVGDRIASTVTLEPGIVVAVVHYDEIEMNIRYLASFSNADRIIVEPEEIISEEEADLLRITKKD